MKYWYCKDDDGTLFLYRGSVAPVKGEEGDYDISPDEDEDYEWIDEDDIVDRFGELSLGVFPGIANGEIIELSIKLIVERV